ncbi:stage II sporulation protein D [Clostridium sp. NSJ-49]|uniref:stage II sporulation protein D n=1 Tax=Clostridium TaxID=1485 RepID=UPI00164B53C1|nr:stage II sporulation protein D [Clostridium sp. NSJ-49]MBC5626727.1 stage II sporulation protein D [Clostridium sp. NSJ-49]
MNRRYKLNLNEGIKFLLFTTICIVVFMIIMPSILIKSEGINLDELSEVTKEIEAEIAQPTTIEVKDIILNDSEMVSVYITSQNKIVDVPLEEYICGVISNEMPATFELEALKAQAVAARTYLASKKIKNCVKANGADICDSVHCQVYTSKEVRLELWQESDREKNWNKIVEAVESTKGQVMSYQNELVLYPQFFSTSSGMTENSVDLYWADIPYLKSVESTGEEIAPKFESEVSMTINEFINKFEESYPQSSLNASNIESSINVISRSEAGGVKEIQVAGETIRGQDFRFLYGLNSSNFTYEINDGNIIFKCKGYGHGVGMSQWGANVMAKEGKTYNEIIKHYYTGVEITNLRFSE